MSSKGWQNMPPKIGLFGTGLLWEIEDAREALKTQKLPFLREIYIYKEVPVCKVIFLFVSEEKDD